MNKASFESNSYYYTMAHFHSLIDQTFSILHSDNEGNEKHTRTHVHNTVIHPFYDNFNFTLDFSSSFIKVIRMCTDVL